jgi:hypothetical protein
MKSRRRAAKKKSVRPAKPALPVHLHIENGRNMGAVFEATPERVKAALKRHPRLKGKV